MIQFSILKRLGGFSKTGLIAAVLGLTLFWACRLGTNEAQEDTFDVAGDEKWISCDTVTIVLLDDAGVVLDTLFNEKLNSLSQLKHLSARKYEGGKAKVYIAGRKAGGSCFEELRSFDDKTDKVTVDTMLAPDTKVVSVGILPDSLNLTTNDNPAQISAFVKPAYADPSFLWSIDDEDIATLEFPNGKNAGKVKVKPLKAGTVKITVRSKQDSSKAYAIMAKIAATPGAEVSMNPDSLSLYVGGPNDSLKAKVLPEGSDQNIEWTSDDAKVATVDSLGHVMGKGAGKTVIRAKSVILKVSDSANITVKVDAPVLMVASRSGAAINVPIVFSAKATQEFGSLVKFKWDLDGDNTWDDSLTGPWTGNSVDLPAVTGKYPKDGKFIANFMVRDGEGNETITPVDLEIGNQAPEILNISNDLTISISDSVSLLAKVKDFEGTVAWCGWDFEGDGNYDDSVTAKDSVVDIVFGHRYKKEGNFNAVLRVKDDVDKIRMDTVKVKVLLDPPVADAGSDTTVMAGTSVNVRAKGTDKYGTITKREIKIGSEAFITISKPDTTIKPPVDSGKFNVVVRVTDDDGNDDVDTMVVTVSTPSKSNADLSELKPSKGTLTPSFKAITAFYSLSVAYADSSITVKASTVDVAATLAVNGKPVESGEASDLVSVVVGTTVNVFQVVVTAQDGTQKIYSIAVTRAPSAETQLSKLEGTGFTLKPTFEAGTLDYSDTVAFALTSITIKPTVSNSAAKVAVNDSTLASGTPTNPLPLKVGDNLMQIKVTAQDGKTKATYTVKVVRRAKLLVSRKLGNLGATQTDSIEAPLGSDVQISTVDTTGYHFTSWIVSEGSGTFADALDSSTTVTLKTAMVRVQANFDINVYTIVTQTDGRGLFTPTTAVVNHGVDDTIAVTPLVGYRVLTLKDNGMDIFEEVKNANFKYILKAISENHTLEATFIPIYTLSAVSTNPSMGAILPLGPMVVDSGTTQTFTLSVNVDGQYAQSLMDSVGNTGTEVASGLTGNTMTTSTYVLTEIKSDHKFFATFALKTFTLTVNGTGVCIKSASCISKLCKVPLGCGTADNMVATVGYGTDWVISTADSNASNVAFSHWSFGKLGSNSDNPATVSLTTGNVTYNAVYGGHVICCFMGSLSVPGSTESTTAPATSPVPSATVPIEEQ